MSNFMFDVGSTYLTLEGEEVEVLGRNDAIPGYETLICSDCCHRYDRSTHNTDSGRTTGTAHNYTYRKNFRRSDHDGTYYNVDGTLMHADGTRHE